jgi:hypothetical protein
MDITAAAAISPVVRGRPGPPRGTIAPLSMPETTHVLMYPNGRRKKSQLVIPMAPESGRSFSFRISFFFLLTPEAYKEKNSKFLQIPSNDFLQMKSFERFSAIKFL